MKNNSILYRAIYKILYAYPLHHCENRKPWKKATPEFVNLRHHDVNHQSASSMIYRISTISNVSVSVQHHGIKKVLCRAKEKKTKAARNHQQRGVKKKSARAHHISLEIYTYIRNSMRSCVSDIHGSTRSAATLFSRRGNETVRRSSSSRKPVKEEEGERASLFPYPRRVTSRDHKNSRTFRGGEIERELRR